jgi:acyl dehydratase
MGVRAKPPPHIRAMSLPALRRDRAVGPFEGGFDLERVRQFCEATKQAHPGSHPQEVVPPGAAVTLLWAAQNAGRDALVRREFQEAATGGVHGEHVMVLRRTIALGEPLFTWFEGWGAHPAGANSIVTLHYVTRDAGDRVVVEQWWSTVWLGVTCAAEGAAAPAHAFPTGARTHPIASWGVDADEEMAHKYAEVSGDWSAHHFDEAAARRSGSERPFLHGLCTLALCTRGVVEMAANGNVGALGLIAVRFARPMPLGGRLELQLYRVGPNEVAFEAQCGDVRVVSNGRGLIS